MIKVLTLTRSNNRIICTRWSSSLLKRINSSEYKNSVAFTEESESNNKSNASMTYGDLSSASAKMATILDSKLLPNTQTVGAFTKSPHTFVITMLATWQLRKVFVPLCITHSANELSYVATDSKLGGIVHSNKSDINTQFIAENSNIPIIIHDDHLLASAVSAHVGSSKDSESKDYDALIIYTSGTTGRPKGVVHTNSNVTNMITSLVQAWKYSERDRILHFLPLYHVHGLVNKLLCLLYVGGRVDFISSAKPEKIWHRLVAECDQKEAAESKSKLAVEATHYTPLTLFMGVPTVYAKMIEYARSQQLSTENLNKALSVTKDIRLMACGSAALPDTIMNDWKKLTGHTLLERYGMTEIGMALTNPLEGEKRVGTVGQPFPGVQVCLVNDDEQKVKDCNTPGELRIKGPTVFSRYLNLPQVTAESFDTEGWFKTGDVAEVSQDGYYKILGRNSTDIIKSSGYKLSALEIEREILGHPNVLEAAVVGAKDDILGEKIIAVITLRNSTETEKKSFSKELTTFLADKLVKYKHPRHVFIVDTIPRNHLGKVNKKKLLDELKIDIPK